MGLLLLISCVHRILFPTALSLISAMSKSHCEFLGTLFRVNRYVNNNNNEFYSIITLINIYLILWAEDTDKKRLIVVSKVREQ